MNKKMYLIILICIILYVFITIGQERLPIEELETINGIGYDIDKKSESMVDYIIPLSISEYRANGARANLVIKDEGKNIGEVIQKRQEKMSRKLVQGQERVILISEDYAKYGIKSIIDDRFRNGEANDMAYMAICKQKPEEIMKFKVKGYASSSEFIEGLIDNASDFNFFSNNYKLIDAFVRVGAEGRHLTLPYIELTETGIKISGLAVFTEDKMSARVDEQSARIMSLLKDDEVKGIMSLQKSPKQYIDFYGKTGKRKIECNKEGDKYSFTINLAMKGSIIDNGMYSGIAKDKRKKEEFEKDMAKSIEKQCSDFIKVMKNQYKVDGIKLGSVGAAKFGRGKGVDWNGVVLNADIKVKVKVKVDIYGRGDY